MRARPAIGSGLGLSLALALAVALAAPAARAMCPEAKGMSPTAECQSFTGFLMPSAAGVLYLPRSGGLGPWVGGGAEIVLLTWSSNNDGFGPSQGKLRFDVAGLASTETSMPAAPAMIMYRGGAVVSFEGNAGRRFLIPYWGAAIGGMHEARLGGHGFVDAELGLYLLYTRNLVVDVEGGFAFPFTDFETLAGPKTQLTASFSFW